MEEVQGKIATQTGHKIRGHEIQMVNSVLAKTDVRERANRIIDFCSKRNIEYLTYHCPILQTGENIWDTRWKDTVASSIQITAKEAEAVYDALSMKNQVIIVVHLTNYITLSQLPITREAKLKMAADTNRAFLSLYKTTLGSEFPSCKFAVENSYPKYRKVYASTGPFHPRELVLPAEYGIGTVLDLSHYQLYSNYNKAGRGNQCGDLDREVNGPAPDWNSCIKILSSSLVQLHINDARGTTESGEGLPLGKGEIDVIGILKEVSKSVPRLVQGTVELSEGHLYSASLQLQSTLWLLRRAPEILA